MKFSLKRLYWQCLLKVPLLRVAAVLHHQAAHHQAVVAGAVVVAAAVALEEVGNHDYV